jgi:hypothetical protein
MSENQLIHQPSQPPANDEPSIGETLVQITRAGIKPEQIDAVERMFALKERQDAKKAEREFVSSFVKLSGSIRHIRASREVKGSDGKVRFTYAPFIDIMNEVGGPLADNGFAMSFKSTTSDDLKFVTVTCILQHVGGHKEESNLTVRVGSGPPGSSDTQKDGAAYEYAKRLALCQRLNIVVDKSDVAVLGDFITPDQAASFRKRVADTGSDEIRFLNLAAADSFENIRTAKVGVLDKMLTQKDKENQLKKAKQ